MQWCGLLSVLGKFVIEDSLFNLKEYHLVGREGLRELNLNAQYTDGSETAVKTNRNT